MKIHAVQKFTIHARVLWVQVMDNGGQSIPLRPTCVVLMNIFHTFCLRREKSFPKLLRNAVSGASGIKLNMFTSSSTVELHFRFPSSGSSLY